MSADLSRTIVLSDQFDDMPKGRLIPGAAWSPRLGGLIFAPGLDPTATRLALHLFPHIERELEDDEREAALAMPAPEGTAEELIRAAHERQEAQQQARWESEQWGEAPPATPDEAARRGRRAFYQQQPPAVRAELEKLTDADFAAGAAFYRLAPSAAGVNDGRMDDTEPDNIFEAGERARLAFYRALPAKELAELLQREEKAATDAASRARWEPWKVLALKAVFGVFVLGWVLTFARLFGLY